MLVKKKEIIERLEAICSIRLTEKQEKVLSYEDRMLQILVVMSDNIASLNNTIARLNTLVEQANRQDSLNHGVLVK